MDMYFPFSLSHFLSLPLLIVAIFLSSLYLLLHVRLGASRVSDATAPGLMEQYYAHQIKQRILCSYIQITIEDLKYQEAVPLFQTGLDYLQSQYEMLCCTYSVQPNGEVKVKKHKQLLHTIHVEVKDTNGVPFNPIQVMEQELNSEFSINNVSPLFRFRVVYTSDKEYHLFACFHHFVCDGMSLTIFWRDFLHLLQQQLTNQPMEIKFNPRHKMDDLIDCRPTVRTLLEALFFDKQINDYRGPVVQNTIAAAHRDTWVHPELITKLYVIDISPSDLEQLQRICKESAFTVHALLCAVAQVALFRTLDLPDDKSVVLTVNSPLDMRRRVHNSAAASDYFGSFVSTAQVVCTLNKSTTTEQLIQSCSQQLKTKMLGSEQKLGLLRYTSIPAYIKKISMMHPLCRTSSIELSNLGMVQLMREQAHADNMPAIKLHSFVFSQGAHYHGPVLTNNVVSTKHNGLTNCLAYSTVNEAMVEKYANQFKSIVQNIVQAKKL
jgi:NRPS condensation-like uncharacterized protein